MMGQIVGVVEFVIHAGSAAVFGNLAYQAIRSREATFLRKCTRSGNPTGYWLKVCLFIFMVFAFGHEMLSDLN